MAVIGGAGEVVAQGVAEDAAGGGARLTVLLIGVVATDVVPHLVHPGVAGHLQNADKVVAGFRHAGSAAVDVSKTADVVDVGHDRAEVGADRVPYFIHAFPAVPGVGEVRKVRVRAAGFLVVPLLGVGKIKAGVDKGVLEALVALGDALGDEGVDPVVAAGVLQRFRSVENGQAQVNDLVVLIVVILDVVFFNVVPRSIDKRPWIRELAAGEKAFVGFTKRGVVYGLDAAFRVLPLNVAAKVEVLDVSAKIVAAEGDDESSALILYVAGSHYYAVDVFVGKVHYALKGPFRRSKSDRVPYLGIKEGSLALFGRKVRVVVGRGRGRDAAVPQVEV